MMGWERAFGILMIFFFSLLGLALFDDKKWKGVSFFIGVAAAVALAGWSNNVPISLQQFWESFVENFKPDSFGLATSTVSLSLSPIIPSKSVRRSVQIASAGGLIMSAFGLPGWLPWLIMGILALCLMIGVYFVAKKVAGWIASMVRGGK